MCAGAALLRRVVACLPPGHGSPRVRPRRRTSRRGPTASGHQMPHGIESIAQAVGIGSAGLPQLTGLITVLHNAHKSLQLCTVECNRCCPHRCRCYRRAFLPPPPPPPPLDFRLRPNSSSSSSEKLCSRSSARACSSSSSQSRPAVATSRCRVEVGRSPGHTSGHARHPPTSCGRCLARDPPPSAAAHPLLRPTPPRTRSPPRPPTPATRPRCSRPRRSRPPPRCGVGRRDHCRSRHRAQKETPRLASYHTLTEQAGRSAIRCRPVRQVKTHLGAKSLSSSPSSASLSLCSASRKDQPPSSMKPSGSCGRRGQEAASAAAPLRSTHAVVQQGSKIA